MIGIIGAGNMGRAMALRLGQKVLVSDCDRAKLRFRKKAHIRIAKNNISLTRSSKVVILAVKPQQISDVLKEIRPYAKSRLIISIAAGVRADFIQKSLPGARVIRVMPNMALLAGKGVSVIAASKSATKKDLDLASAIFSRFGEVIVLKEDLMDAVTAVSGSGPAYYFLFTDILEKSARLCGLKSKIASRLAKATFIGAAYSAESADLSMQEFVKKVASKGGTTEAALKVFKKRGLERIVKEAVRAAAKRSLILNF